MDSAETRSASNELGAELAAEFFKSLAKNEQDSSVASRDPAAQSPSTSAGECPSAGHGP
jgi:hypothetical protein